MINDKCSKAISFTVVCEAVFKACFAFANASVVKNKSPDSSYQTDGL